MSYTLTVVVKGAEASVTKSGDVPDGEFVINGHEDANQRTFGAVRRGADGRYVAAAHSTHYKEG